MLKRNALLVAVATMVSALLAACGGGQDRQVIQNKGSDTLVNVAQAWAEAYQTVDSATVVAVSGGGSGTGIAALINGTVDIANASRAMKDKEIKLAKDGGHNPIQHIVGYDALAVYLHEDNPLNTISIEQLAEIYGDGGTYAKWTDLGVEVPGCKDQTMVVVSRQNNSGTYAYFRQTVLGKGDFRLGTRDMHGSKDVVDLVENTPCAIGYSGLAYATEHLKLACISAETGGACVDPSVATASDGSYPIARPLFMYTNGEPTGYVGKYLDWIKSETGQCIISEKGYAPAVPVNCG
ncbi:MAG: PstS family phosphate ABC transporter substrate-binding protein [Gammaproteobacteria bacterium]|nr:PstS family phosphate ABC transporter substrate-binding protein [Gammaproteobacteria bacterium]MBT8075616.1 PstS family phosphate ABC transporter substrate-binding protein [Gammaproteobacteria bacterium]NNL00306.1 PstS family phosphate ABC transporter substrate-binding protein [Xanthomonadales bacterium]